MAEEEEEIELENKDEEEKVEKENEKLIEKENEKDDNQNNFSNKDLSENLSNKNLIQEKKKKSDKNEYKEESSLQILNSNISLEIPTETIIFSSLSKEEKLKYFNFFLANDTIFNRESEGTWIAEIDIFEDKEEEEEEKMSSPDLKFQNKSKSSTLQKAKSGNLKKNYDPKYNKLLNVIKPPEGIKGTKMNLSAIKYMIQEIYSLKFMKDTQALLNQDEAEPEEFPVFVGQFFVNKFPKKDTSYKKAIDFMLSLDFYSLNHKDIKIFQQFVTEEYDSDDLIFYLFVRSCIEKEQKLFFLEKAKENLTQDKDDDILVPSKHFKKLAKSIFGNDEETLLNNFLENIQKLLETESYEGKKKFLKSNSILNMALEKYHEYRGSDSDTKDVNDNENETNEENITIKEKKLDEKNNNEIKEDKSETESEKEENENSDEQKEEIVEQKSKTEIKKPQKKNETNTNKKNIKVPTLSTSTIPKKPVTNSGKTVKISTTISTKPPPSSKISKPSTGIKKPANKQLNINKSSMSGKISKGQKSDIIKNKPSNPPSSIEIKSSLTSKAVNKLVKEPKIKVNTAAKKKLNSSVGKRPIKKEEETIEQSEEFKKILNKNKIEKVKTDVEKSTCLLYIINDYFKLKEIDSYFKNIVDMNPMFKAFSSQILANIKTAKEFMIKKLSGICKYISAGDKNGYHNFIKIKEKGDKNNFEILKNHYNSLLKIDSLKNLAEKDVENFCKLILDIPELTVQTTKTLLNFCE